MKKQRLGLCFCRLYILYHLSILKHLVSFCREFQDLQEYTEIFYT